MLTSPEAELEPHFVLLLCYLLIVSRTHAPNTHTMQRYLTICMLIVSVAHAYKLDKKLDAGNFLGYFDFIDTPDKYTGGCVSYISKSEATSMGLACVVGNQVYLVVDNNAVIDVKPQGGRKSVRLESQCTIDNGLVIADFAHLPANACGM